VAIEEIPMRKINRLGSLVLAAACAISVSHAQDAVGGEEESPTDDPDVIAAEELVRELRESAESARLGPDEALPEQVDALISGIEATTSDPDIDLQERFLTQSALVNSLRGRYTDNHPTLIRARRQLEQLEAQLPRRTEAPLLE
jgi:hypothetical protein